LMILINKSPRSNCFKFMAEISKFCPTIHLPLLLWQVKPLSFNWKHSFQNKIYISVFLTAVLGPVTKLQPVNISRNVKSPRKSLQARPHPSSWLSAHGRLVYRVVILVLNLEAKC
jgi:hypothetical protein